jgi:hypothetical protein
VSIGDGIGSIGEAHAGWGSGGLRLSDADTFFIVMIVVRSSQCLVKVK